MALTQTHAQELNGLTPAVHLTIMGAPVRVGAGQHMHMRWLAAPTLAIELVGGQVYEGGDVAVVCARHYGHVRGARPCKPGHSESQVVAL